MSDSNNETGHIIQSLIVNVLIALAKGFAAFMTKSGAMLAETIHSFADCSNQLLLLLGVKQAEKPADDSHPFGYGASVYFWSFMVAILLFSVGGMFSVYEGWHKLHNPEPVEKIGWGVGILIFSICLEGYATLSNIKSINSKKKRRSFVGYIRNTKESDLIVIFGENSAAVLGLVFALAALLLSYYTGDPRYDAAGSIAIGLVLIAVAVFLATEIKSLLIGESADDEVKDAVQGAAAALTGVESVINMRTVQQGPGSVLVCVKIKCNPHLSVPELSKLINDFEQNVRTQKPEVKYMYVEPDLQEWKNEGGV